MDLVTLEPHSPENLFSEELTQMDEAQASIHALGTFQIGDQVPNPRIRVLATIGLREMGRPIATRNE